MVDSKASDSKPQLDYCTPESWETARSYTSLIGEVPNSFSSLIRSLVADQEKGSNKLSSASTFQIGRILRGSAMRSVLYYAGLTLHTEPISSAKSLTNKELLQHFAPLELAVIIATTYLYRSIRKISQSGEWQGISELTMRYIDIGGHLGVAIPRISAAHGMICGALPVLAHAVLLKHDEKGYKEYRRQLTNSNLRYISEYEASRWGCTTFQIASILMQTLGLGRETSQSLVLGLSPASSLAELPEDAYRYKIADTWIIELNARGQPPEMTHRGEYYPLRNELNTLLAAIKQIRSAGSQHRWLEKSKDDISPSLTPALFTDQPKSTVAAESEPPVDQDIATEAAELEKIDILEE